MSTPSVGAPDWDLEQLEVILDDKTSWQLVEAGPGAGKSAVACQRIAYLVDEGVPPSRILLVSFTRTAVQELRDRIVLYAVAGDRARNVRISTIDSHAWSLRSGCDDDPIPRALGNQSYDLNIERTVELFRRQLPELCEFMGTLEHLIVDEAQDVMGVRADLVLELLKNVSKDCGVTILADPSQAIYGFTTDELDERASERSLLARLGVESPRELTRRELLEIHRVQNDKLVDLFVRTRRETHQVAATDGHVERVQLAIRESCGRDFGVATYSSVADFLSEAGEQSMLVLFRRRADVLFASSYCSQVGVQHRLRMAELPVVVHAWIGWLFGEYVHSLIARGAFDELWERMAAAASEPFAGWSRDDCWALLHQLAAGRRAGTIDLVQLRRLVSRVRPPLELCTPELGRGGPILGTIHASKGREADTVVLVMAPPENEGERSSSREAELLEEGRVYYVGATRARRMLIAAGNSATSVGYLDSKRVFRRIGDRRAQLEIGRDGDVDRLAHLAWSGGVAIQHALASSVGRVAELHARTAAEADYATRLLLELRNDAGVTRIVEIGQMSVAFAQDMGRLWSRMDPEKTLKPAPSIHHLYLADVTTVGLSDSELSAVRPPFDRSGLALAPVVKGFPTVQFLYRRGRSQQ